MKRDLDLGAFVSAAKAVSNGPMSGFAELLNERQRPMSRWKRENAAIGHFGGVARKMRDRKKQEKKEKKLQQLHCRGRACVAFAE